MTAEIFADGIKEEIIEDTLENYERVLDEIKERGKLLPVYQRIGAIYDKLSEEEKDDFFDFLEFTMNETVSSMLALLEGETMLEDQEDRLKLVTERSNKDEVADGAGEYFREKYLRDYDKR